VRRFLTRSVRWLGALAVLIITGWGALALAVVGPGGDQGRLVLAAVYVPSNERDWQPEVAKLAYNITSRA
jgi:hypothetical protein